MAEDFAALGVRRELVEALHNRGLKKPTPVQVRAIPILLDAKDAIVQAQTGTGKTLAFLLPIFERINVKNPNVQALILTPTRELAIQITSEAKKLAPIRGANVLATYGGQDVDAQIKKLSGATQIVVATPGRLLDHLRRGTIRLDQVSMLVLDEADQMLHMGFLPDVELVMAQAAIERSTMLFSATMPDEIKSLARRYMRSPVEIQIQGRHVTLDEIQQIVVETTDRNKQDALFQKLDEYNPYLGLIFCRTKLRSDLLLDAMLTRGFNAKVLHGDLSQSKREQVMKEFREAKIQYLVATDVAARGLDVEGVTHVFNYDIPHDAESYIHRIGRTGRAGQTGIAVTFATLKDQVFLQMIEQGVKSTLERMNVKGERDPATAPKEDRVREARPEGVSRRQFAQAVAKRTGGPVGPGGPRRGAVPAGGRRGGKQGGPKPRSR